MRNEAKQRLKTLRVGNPTAKLAEAQLALARDFGFASWRNAEAVRWLIEHKVDVNAKAHAVGLQPDRTAIAADDGNAEIARMLLDAGADPSICDDKYDSTSLGWAEFCEQS